MSFSLNRLAARIRSGKEETISFDKDDDDTLDFVTASANLRATAYGIQTKSRWEVKGMFIRTIRVVLANISSFTQRWLAISSPLSQQRMLSSPVSLSCRPSTSYAKRSTHYATSMSSSGLVCL